jgi:hypothetical protein
VDVDERVSLSSLGPSEHAIIGVIAPSERTLIVHSKTDKLRRYVWENSKYRADPILAWSISAKSAVSFSKPVVVSGSYLMAPFTGQSTLGVYHLTTGTPAMEPVDTTSLGASGMVMALSSRGNQCIVLTESGHLISIIPSEKTTHMIRDSLPQTERTDQAPTPTALFVSASTMAVGFSDGTVWTDQEGKISVSPGDGIGAITCIGDSLLCGTWKGHLRWIGDANKSLTSPHACSIVSMEVSPCGTRLAVGSTDGRVSFWDIHDS